VFLPLIKTSQLMAEILNRKGLRTVHLDGTSEEVDWAIKQYENGVYDCICNALLFTEGVDIPCIDHVTNLRITKSRGTYSQIVGRGTRLCDGKDKLTILDFLWHSKRHRLCTPASLITEDEKVQDAMNKKLKKGGSINLMDEHDEAKSSIAKEIAKNSYKARESIDPLKHYGVDADQYEEKYDWQKDPASQNQIDYLARHGMKPDGWTKGLAAHVIDGIRSHGGLTWKQNKFLSSRGINTKGLSFDAASSMIDAELRKIQNTKRWTSPR
jgi:superfamily II DNA or RNA helicase